MRTLPVLVALVGLTATARADGLVEFVGGGAIPVSDDQYTDTVDNSPKFGLRFAAAGVPGVGVEAGLDVTPVSLEVDNFGVGEASAWRIRALVGARGQWAVGGKGVVMARIAGGADLARYAVSGSVLGVSFDRSQTDVGVALEAGLGLGVRLGKVVVGGQVALPLALHFNDDDPADPDDFDFEYTALDVDLLFTVGTTM